MDNAFNQQAGFSIPVSGSPIPFFCKPLLFRIYIYRIPVFNNANIFRTKQIKQQVFCGLQVAAQYLFYLAGYGNPQGRFTRQLGGI